MKHVLELRNIQFAYPTMPDVLQGITLTVKTGSKIALVGPNGAGKTTVLLMCNGTLRPTGGEVRLNGVPLRYDTRSLREVRKKVGLVFQNSDMQLFAPTVYQDVAFGPLNLGMEGEELEGVVQSALLDVGLAGYGKRPPHHLSGGEKKRVAIAGILAMEPDVLVFDEPTSSLDPAGAEEIMDLLDELNQSGRTILLSTHDVELAFRWADEVVFMHGGKILRTGTPTEVFSDEELLRKARLKPPMLVELHQQLVRRGIIDSQFPPTGMLGFLDQVERRVGQSGGQGTGLIYLCDINTMSNDGIQELIAHHRITSVGAMGSQAKHLAQRERIDLDVTYGVIDRCILLALAGETPLILTSGGMIEHSQHRIRAYSEESGIPLGIELVVG